MLSTVFVGVLNDRPAVLVGFETGKGGALKVIDNRTNLSVGRVILTRPADHSRCIAVHSRQP